MQDEKAVLYTFGEWRLDARARFLWYRNEPVDLPPKAIDLLGLLVEKRGEVATKDEIWSQVWKGVVVEESNLTHNIYLLRKTFRDLAGEDPIRTVPRRGYRFTTEPRVVVREAEVIYEKSTITSVSIEESSTDGLLSGFLGRVSPARAIGAAVFLTFALASGFAAFSIWSATEASSSESREIGSVAVLPFKVIGNSAGDEVFPLGLSDSLIARLSRIEGLAVRPYDSVEKCRSERLEPVECGRALGVDAVLAGTVQHFGNRYLTSVNLVSAVSGKQVWGYQTVTDSGDLLVLQSAVSKGVVRGLLSKLGKKGTDPGDGRLTGSSEAYAFYLAGRERLLSRDMTADSLVFFRKAIELDPGFALAHLGMADQLAISGDTAGAEKAVQRAIELDPGLHEAYATLGFIQMFHKWDWARAEASLKTAIELAPNSSKAHHWYGVFLSLRSDFDGALEEMQTASKLDPTASVIRADIAEVFYFKGDYRRAEKELEDLLVRDPSCVLAGEKLVKVRYKMGGSYFRESLLNAIRSTKGGQIKSRWAEAELSKMEELAATGTDAGIRSYLISKAEKQAAANARDNWTLAILYSASGDRKRAASVLREALKARAFMMPFAAVDPLFDGIRNEPEFGSTMREIGLAG